MNAHDRYAEALTAYALDALDMPDRDAFEAHLSSCAECRAELAELRRVATALAQSVEPEAPPADLRSRTLLAATSERQASAASAGPAAPTSRRRPVLPWLAAAAALAFAVGAGVYARSLRIELEAVKQLASVAVERAESLRIELLALRRDQSILVRVREVMAASDVRLVDLRGQGAAAGATGSALWSPTHGLVFNGTGLPAPDAARVYQLWVVPTAGAPESAGLLTISPDGRASHVTALPTVPNAALVAITIEPAGGSPAPTGPMVMSGGVRSTR